MPHTVAIPFQNFTGFPIYFPGARGTLPRAGAKVRQSCRIVKLCLRLSGTARCLALVNFGGTFHAAEDVVDGLASQSNEFSANDARDKVSGDVHDFFGGAAVEPFAENRGHGPGKRLDFVTEAHLEVAAARVVDVQEDADGVGAFLVFADVFEVEGGSFFGGAIGAALGVVDEHLALFGVGEDFEKIDDLVERSWVTHRSIEGRRILRVLLDGRADHVAPFGPASIVIAHLFKTEKSGEDKPGVT